MISIKRELVENLLNQSGAWHILGSRKTVIAEKNCFPLCKSFDYVELIIGR